MAVCLATILVLVVAAALPGCGGNRPPAAPPQAAGIPSVRVVSAAERGEYLGSSACLPCHPRQAHQLQSRHAQTLNPVSTDVHGSLFRIRARVTDPLDEVTLEPRVANGKCVLRATSPHGTTDAVAEYAFGSGAIGYTFLSYPEGRPTELRLSHYVRGSRWEFTPGQRMGGAANSPAGQVLSPRSERTCLACHTTVLLQTGKGLDLPGSLLGIGCEACHGPGKAHVEAARARQPDLKMLRLSQYRNRLSMELCGQCHRAPENVDLHAPGMAVQLPRMQSIALANSECFQKGGISCLSCHDPHGDARSTARADYAARCRGCHTGAVGRPTCPSQPAGDCIPCHMPAQDVGMPTSPRFRNHWIRVWPVSNDSLSLP